MATELLELVYVLLVSLVRRAEGVLALCLRQIRYLPCALRGHDENLQFKKDRLYLRCTSCGYETPGWELDRKMPLVPARTELRLTYARRVSERRMA